MRQFVRMPVFDARIGAGEPPIKRFREAAMEENCPELSGAESGANARAPPAEIKNLQDLNGRPEKSLRSVFPEQTIGNFVHRDRDGVEDRAS
jgi:hypothetical protein